ncbi:hypothetical protein [Paraburkholderia sp. BL17N1]|uniref:hypothetical protein n=1 Tax=Paraburkholderia sp. BL17N1 TaxID=1938798 RepID=UPI000EB0154E|nr:hypothetical protein [Paraburkholderia sp. BL17N1]RKR38203.1 hypothetical protein B0G82_6328 [Paraburkholderia sp. BL17N1]
MPGLLQTFLNGSNNVLAYGGPNSSIFAQGTDNTFDTSGSYVYGQGNDTFTVNGSGDTITNGANSISWVTGSSDNLAYVGQNSLVNISGQGEHINGNTDVINCAAGFSGNVEGGADQIGLAGTGDYLGLLGGSGYSINAQNSTIGTSDNTSFMLNGSGNSLGLGAHNAVSVNGSGNAVNAGSNSVILDNGVNNTINATNSVIQLGSQNIGQTIYINGNGNTIDAATLLSKNPVVQADIVVRGTGNTIIASNQKIDLNGTTGNFVTANNATYYNSPNAFSYVSGASLSGTYGPLNPAAPSTPGVFFPEYDPSAGGTGGAFTNGGVWNGDPDISGMLPMYDLPLDDCSGSGYNADGVYNVVVCGGGVGASTPAFLSATSSSTATSAAASAARVAIGAAAPVSRPASFDKQDNNAAASPTESTDDTALHDALAAMYQDRGQAFAVDTTSGAMTADVAVQSLIAALASFGADSSASASYTASAQNDPQMLLAASAA